MCWGIMALERGISIAFHRGGRVGDFPPLLPNGKRYSPLGTKEVCNSDWFSDDITRIARSGFHTFFWDDLWLGNIPIKLKYHSLFSNFIQQKGSDGELGVVVNEVFT